MTDDKIRNQSFLSGTNEGRLQEEKKGLKQPRDLYSTASLHHMPKWPIECQVIPEKIRHIDTILAKLEHFYRPSYSENQPKPVGEEMGTVIFDYQPKLSVEYFCRARAGGGENIHSFETDSNTLKFESRFESGNLAKAIKITNVYYELYLRPDMYTDRHFQWFYFRIQNTRDNITYRFSIVNLTKPDSLYRYGLKPLMYSDKDAQLNNMGWIRCGQSISYYKNDVVTDDNNVFYTLTFNLRFHHNNDTVYIAQCYPYTYTNLQQHLADVEVDEIKSKYCQQRLLCRSLAGNNIYVLTITSPDTYLEESSKKPVVVISARVHPGETQSSYMMKGIIDFLTSNYSQAKELRDQFIFKLIPMLNPDGVIVGNSRCCLLGQDLNRQYRTVLREAFPQIYHTKVMLRRLMDENGIYMYCDLHGHSRRNNAFMYGCENKRVPEKRLTEQVFPLMMHKNASDKFSFQSCKFKVQKSKEGTGRVFAWTLGVSLSYTLEVSLGGSTMPSRQDSHFTTYDYEGIGRHFCETLLDYADNSPSKERLRERILQRLLQSGSRAEEPMDISITDYSSLSHSESEESGDEGEVNAEKPPPVIRNPPIKAQSIIRPKNQIKSARAPIAKVERSVLSLSGSTVDDSKAGQKYHSSCNENEITISPSQSQKEKDTKAKEEQEKEKDKDKDKDRKERQMKRRKRLKRVSFDATSDKQIFKNPSLMSTKCTSILFDDPFNPPAPDVQTTSKSNVSGGTAEILAPSAPMAQNESDDTSTRRAQIYLPCTSTSVTDIIDDVAFLQLSPRLEETKSSTSTTITTDLVKVPKSRPKTPKTNVNQQDPKPERKLFAMQKQSSVRRESTCSLPGKYEMSNKSSPTHIRRKSTFLNYHHSSFSHKSSMAQLRTKIQQSKVLLSETHQYSSTSLYYNSEAHGFGVGKSTGDLRKPENLRNVKKTLKKCKSVGDKLDEAAHVHSTYSRSDIVGTGNIATSTSTGSRTKKLKRNKVHKN